MDFTAMAAVAAEVVTAVAVLLMYLVYQRTAARSEVQSQQKITNAESRVEAEPERAKPAWDLARVTLEAYFNRNLSQIASIFWLSVVVMLLGFSVLLYGVLSAINYPEHIKPSALATLSGIVTEFIGATFLFIYRSTITQAVNYSKTLERINSVGMAMQILDTMPDGAPEEDLKSKTKARLVELLVRQSYEIKPTSESETKPEPAKKPSPQANDSE
jgi:hypothetical protein